MYQTGRATFPLMNSAQRFIDTVREALAARGMSQRAAARRLGVSQQYLHRRLTGQVPMSLGDFLALASLLELDLELTGAAA